jgi:tetratricopeptide (TPR) repeat protein
MANAADDHLRMLPADKAPTEFAGQQEALAWLDAERASLVAAVRLAASTGRDRDALRLPLLLSEYSYRRHWFDDGIACASISMTAARRLCDRRHEGDALTALGLALVQARRFEEAITAQQAAAAAYKEDGSHRHGGLALNNLGLALRNMGRVEEAITAHQAAAAIYRETGDRRDEASALEQPRPRPPRGRASEGSDHGLPRRCRDLPGDRRPPRRSLGPEQPRHRPAADGPVGEAITAHQASAAIFAETNDGHREGSALTNLGNALRQAGRVEQAITACQDAAAIYRETGDRHAEGLARSAT